MLENATVRLESVGVPSARVDAEWLLADTLGLSRGELASLVLSGGEIESRQRELFEGRLARRETREPLQHILGRSPFLDFEVRVGPGVFIPRPETESLAERVRTHAQSLGVSEAGVNIVDLCAGSGVLAIALARAVPYATVTAVEASEHAMPYLWDNIQALAPEVTVHHSDVTTWGSSAVGASVDILVANPPYIPATEVPNDPEVAQFDPALALYSGADGLDLIREIAQIAARVLRSGALLALEHSNLQGDAVREILASVGMRTVETYRDLTDRDRFTSGFKP